MVRPLPLSPSLLRSFDPSRPPSDPPALRPTYVKDRDSEDRCPQQREGIVVKFTDILRHLVALIVERVPDGVGVAREMAGDLYGFVGCRPGEDGRAGDYGFV